MDADLATNINCIHDLVETIETGAEVVVGSRMVAGAHAKRPFVRIIASKIYNYLVRLLFQTGIQDHQCGFKGFRNLLEIFCNPI